MYRPIKQIIKTQLMDKQNKAKMRRYKNNFNKVNLCNYTAELFFLFVQSCLRCFCDSGSPSRRWRSSSESTFCATASSFPSSLMAGWRLQLVVGADELLLVRPIVHAMLLRLRQSSSIGSFVKIIGPFSLNSFTD